MSETSNPGGPAAGPSSRGVAVCRGGAAAAKAAKAAATSGTAAATARPAVVTTAAAGTVSRSGAAGTATVSRSGAAATTTVSRSGTAGTATYSRAGAAGTTTTTSRAEPDGGGTATVSRSGAAATTTVSRSGTAGTATYSRAGAAGTATYSRAGAAGTTAYPRSECPEGGARATSAARPRSPSSERSSPSSSVRPPASSFGPVSARYGATAARYAATPGGGREVERRVREAFEQHASEDADGTFELETRRLREALRSVGIDANADEAIQMMSRYDSRGTGRLVLGDFARLVKEFEAFSASASNDPPAAADPQPSARDSARNYGHGRGERSYDDQRDDRHGGRLDGRREYDRDDARDQFDDGHMRDLPEMPPVNTSGVALDPPAFSSVAPPVAPPMPLPGSIPHLGSAHVRHKAQYQGRPSTRRASSARRARWAPSADANVERDGAGRRAWGATGGGVYAPREDYLEQIQVAGDEAAVLRDLIEHAGGKTLHPSQQWIARALRAVELRYQATARNEAVHRFNLEVRLGAQNLRSRPRPRVRNHPSLDAP